MPLLADRLADLGPTLCVWAHPDDETYLAAGVMASLRAVGHRVVCVTATRGELGGQALPAELAAIRTRELEAALAVLGVAEHHWLDLPDGGCAAVPAEGPIEAITRLVLEARPRTVLTFGPDGITGHPDHQAVGAWTRAAVHRSGSDAQLLEAAVTAADIAASADVDRRLGVLVGDPPEATREADLAVRAVLDGDLLDRKLAALAALDSQTAWARQLLGLKGYADWVRIESFRQSALTSVSRGQPLSGGETNE